MQLSVRVSECERVCTPGRRGRLESGLCSVTGGVGPPRDSRGAETGELQGGLTGRPEGEEGGELNN